MIPAILMLVGQTGTGLPHEVTKSTQFKAGTYRLTQPIVVSGVNVVLDGGGATLLGNGAGVGIQIQKGSNVTVKNLKIKGFRWGLVAEGSAGLKLISVDSSGNQNYPEAAAGKVVMDMEGGKEPDYGGGILLRGVSGGLLQGIHAHGQWNGLTLSGCTTTVVERSDFSKNDDTGIHLWASSDNEIRDCRITWIGIGMAKNGSFAHKGGDQAGILLEHDSSRNKVLRNNLVHCVGDGVFLRANELAPVPAAEAKKQGAASVGDNPVLLPTHPSNDNLFQENDASFAEDANSFESDFCSGNQFIKNVAAYSNYGFWLGFSRNATVRGNLVVGNKTRGLQLDNGWANVVEGNTFIRDYGSPTAMYFSDEEANATHPNHGAQNRSGDIRIFDNVFIGHARPFHFINSSPATVQSNTWIYSGALEPTITEDAIAEVTGTRPLFIGNGAEKHTGPDFIPSLGNAASVPSMFDTVGGVSILRLEPKAKSAIVEASLTGVFDGEEFELGRLEGPGRLCFPSRPARFIRVRGAAASPSAFLALFGDQSLAKAHATTSSSGRKLSDFAVDGDWDTPELSWRPDEKIGENLQVDLHRPCLVDGFAIASNVVNPHDFWSKFHIEVSESGLFSGEEKTVLTEADWDHRPGPVRVYRIPPIRARFVRIVGDVAQKWVQLQEFGVYGTEE
ncbi:right-handed parallel beta-helix repeat-containing protein [Fimbriimonas ginsengisoli]|nr:right-handed parallel beta-helix repeat-containing protein [Fimbriimonas ginsengisoli]